MRYTIADENHDLWGHLFDEDDGVIERHCRFVYDNEEEELARADIRVDHRWIRAGRHSLNDLEDSLKDANPEALEDPEAWNLGQSDEMPDWAKEEATPEP